jgi:hypothetical protein
VTSTTLPRPLIDDGQVTNDLFTRTLTVRPASHASGTAKLLWRDAVRAVAISLDGPAGMARAPWANGAGQSQIAFGQPTDDGAALEFQFHRGHPAYRELVPTPGLRARIALDRATGQIISVTFRGR